MKRKEQRRQIFVNARFQIPIAVKLALLSLTALVVVTGVVCYVNNNNVKQAEQLYTRLEKTLETEDNIVQAFISVAKSSRGSGRLQLAVQNVTKDHDESMTLLRSITPHLRSLEKQNRYLIYGLVGLGFFQFLILIWYGIRLTRRIAGPVTVMKSMITRLQNKQKNTDRTLRKNDLLQDLFEELSKLDSK